MQTPRVPRSGIRRLREVGEWRESSPPPPLFSSAVVFASFDQEAPLPMPGTFKPVFDATVQLPTITYTYDSVFTAVGEVLCETVAHSSAAGAFQACGLSTTKVKRQLLAAFFAGMSIQMSRAHKTLGLGPGMIRGEYPRLPATLQDVVSVFGEFEGPDGRIFSLHDYPSSLKSLVRCASRLRTARSLTEVLSQQWLPTSPEDGNTREIVARRLSFWFKERGFDFPVSLLRSHVLTGAIPVSVEAKLNQFSLFHRAMIVRSFSSFHSEAEFLAMFTDPVGTRVMSELELAWDNPKITDLQFNIQVQPTMAAVLAEWKFHFPAIESSLGVCFIGGFDVMPTGRAAQFSCFSTEPEATYSSHYAVPL